MCADYVLGVDASEDPSAAVKPEHHGPAIVRSVAIGIEYSDGDLWAWRFAAWYLEVADCVYGLWWASARDRGRGARLGERLVLDLLLVG